MAVIKFHEKNVVLFTNQEVTAGTYLAPTGSDVVAAVTLTGAVTYVTGALMYLGDSNSRNEVTYQKDSFADVTLETPLQILGTLNPSILAANVPLSDWLQASGATITVNGDGSVLYSNATMNPLTISVDYRKTTAQNTVNQKLIKFYGCQALVDVTANIGDVPRLKFALKGNAYDPIEATSLTPNYGTQVQSVGAPIRQQSIVAAQIAPLGEVFTAQASAGTVTTITKVGNIATVTMSAVHGLVSGRYVNISGSVDPLYNGDFLITVLSTTTFSYVMQATPAANATGTPLAKVGGYAKSFCHANLGASNFFGRDLARYQTGCEEGFSSTSVPSDVTVTMLESEATNFTITGITFITTAATVTAPSHNMVTGDYVVVSGATGVDAAIYNGYYKVTVLTSSTFSYTMLSTPAGVATGTLIGMNNNRVQFDPDLNISNFFTVQLKFGTGVGKYVTFTWDNLQLADVKEAKVGQYFGREVKFRNTGVSSILLS